MRILFLLILAPFLSFSQTIQVPEQMYFMGMKIVIKGDARSEIAASIASLKKNRTYFQTKLDRVDAYFPIIERIFEEENVPEDFKFLVVQESALISDAVSKSNAVGFWQFKRESAIESGLRIDDLVDERKNISASTRGAAIYLKKSNAVFNNWIYTLQSYNVGLGGTQRSVDTRFYGVSEMTIDGNTHWYILKCIAHKLAFGDEEGVNNAPPIVLFEYRNSSGKTFQDIARELEVDEGKLREYNKWLSHHTIPDDKEYIVTVPSSYLEKDAVAAKIGTDVYVSSSNKNTDGLLTIKPDVKPLREPKKISNKAEEMYPGEKPVFVLHNGLEAIKAKQGDDINKLAIQAGISRSKFLKFNDLRIFDQLIPNEYYYIENKQNKANVLFHIVKQGETLRDVSQLYGITIQGIVRKNRMKKGEPLQPGRELWLRNRRPEEVPIKIVPLPKTVSNSVVTKKPIIVKKDTVAITPKPVLVIPTQITQPNKTPIEGNSIPVKENPILTPTSTSSPSTPQSTSVVVPEVKSKPEPTLVTHNLPKVYFKDTIHIVQQKENIYSISRLYNTRPDSLRAWNVIDSTGIKIDQVLKVKKLEIEQVPEFKVHIVASGETMYRISDMYKVPVQKIQEWNNKKDFTLSAGDILFIKKQP
jgi:membrane-bound lytic murein transglycosylase D